MLLTTDVQCVLKLQLTEEEQPNSNKLTLMCLHFLHVCHKTDMPYMENRPVHQHSAALPLQ